MRWCLIVGFLLGACGPTPPATPQPPAIDAAAPEVVEGAVCHRGKRNPEPDGPVVDCGPTMQCCYPCGIDGCDSVCMVDCGPPRP